MNRRGVNLPYTIHGVIEKTVESIHLFIASSIVMPIILQHIVTKNEPRHVDEAALVFSFNNASNP